MTFTKEQLEMRRNYITGTDAATICGMNPYDTPMKLWQRKMGLVPEPDLSHNPKVRAGKALEPIVCDMFSTETGLITMLVDEGLTFSIDYPWMAGTPDAAVINEGVFLECKTASNPHGWGETGSTEIPFHYHMQIAHYMALTNTPYIYVAVLIQGWDFRWYKIDRHKRLEEHMIAKEKEFYQYMKDQVPPPPKTTEDVLSLYKNEVLSEAIVATEEIVEAYEDVVHLKKVIKSEEESYNEAKDIICAYMKNHDTLRDANGKIMATWKASKPSQKFDMDSFKKDHPQLYKDYLIEVDGSRRFLLKGD